MQAGLTIHVGGHAEFVTTHERKQFTSTDSSPVMTAFADSDRVREHTHPEVLARLDIDTAARLMDICRDPGAIRERLAELDSEWDIERTLEVNAASLILGGTALSAMTGRRSLLVVPLVVSGFLIQHAVQGWCPPLALFRRLGIRTHLEIDAERAALLSCLADVHDDSVARSRLRSGLPEPMGHTS
jgi:hypothetical protein